ncbi:g358 [Coccomyxa elongata]
MVLIARTDSSPRKTKKRQSFIRSGQSGDLPAAKTDLESGTDQENPSTSHGDTSFSHSATTRTYGRYEHRSRPGGGLSEVAKGQLCLMGVAMLWGSYGPAIRYVYSLKGPPSAEALTAVRAVLQAVILLVSMSIFGGRKERKVHPRPDEVQDDDAMREESVSGWNQPYGAVRAWLSGNTSSLAVAGVELGLWNFLATSAQALGLEITSATRASFLIQLTALLTPALAMAAGEKPAKSVWFGCLFAMAGTILLTLDNAPRVAPPANAAHIAIGGDACILAAAFFYSLATVRLSRLAANVSSLELAASKSLALATISLGWIGISAANQVVSHESLVALWEGYADPAAWLVLLWSALGPGALAAYLQTRGQSKVPAAQAQIIFSSLPLWSALFAALLLHGEKMGIYGWLGGLIILLAGIVASRK